MSVVAQPAFEKGFKLQFLQAQKEFLPDVQAFVGPIMRDVESDGAFERYVHWTSALHPEYRPRTTPGRDGHLEAVAWTVENVDWRRKVVWHYRDEQDDRSRYLRSRAAELAENWLLLRIRVACQIMEAAADPLLLPALPTGADGLDIFNTGNRFGVTGGNVVSSLTLNTENGWEDGVLECRQRLTRFRGTGGIGQVNGDFALKNGIIIYYSMDNAAVVWQAMNRRFRNIAGDGGTRSNIFIDGLMRIEIKGTVHLSGTDIYVAIKNHPVSPMIHQTLQPIEFRAQTRENSDEGRDLGLVGFIGDSVEGFGVSVPYGIVKGTA